MKVRRGRPAWNLNPMKRRKRADIARGWAGGLGGPELAGVKETKISRKKTYARTESTPARACYVCPGNHPVGKP